MKAKIGEETIEFPQMDRYKKAAIARDVLAKILPRNPSKRHDLNLLTDKESISLFSQIFNGE